MMCIGIGRRRESGEGGWACVGRLRASQLGEGGPADFGLEWRVVGRSIGRSVMLVVVMAGGKRRAPLTKAPGEEGLCLEGDTRKDIET